MNSQASASRAAQLVSDPRLNAMTYDELRSRVEEIVRLEEEHLEIAGQPWLWHKVADPDDLLNEAVLTDDRPAADVDPFWAVAWRAAVGLDSFLSRMSLKDVRVLELGAGSGHAGIAAAQRGAIVTITDTVDLALLVARLNAWPVRDRVTFGRLRWAEQVLRSEPFPIILGSDLVYDPNHFPN